MRSIHGNVCKNKSLESSGKTFTDILCTWANAFLSIVATEFFPHVESCENCVTSLNVTVARTVSKDICEPITVTRLNQNLMKSSFSELKILKCPSTVLEKIKGTTAEHLDHVNFTFNAIFVKSNTSHDTFYFYETDEIE